MKSILSGSPEESFSPFLPFFSTSFQAPAELDTVVSDNKEPGRQQKQTQQHTDDDQTVKISVCAVAEGPIKAAMVANESK